MRAAISVPDALFPSAEQFAEPRGVTRSQLYATALRHYRQEQRRDAITDQLNAIHADAGLPKDAAVNVAQIITVDKSFLTERVGRVDAQIMLLVEDEVRTVLGV